ncbi:flagellar basal body rod protein FlgB [Gorillibacterium sp. sgz5001074]|uniref:flagellar basal body rod protein FlgB n=1 Tax=Gorillibacterium sp. sgz5001074 TaxID=3446695 RepID=UPI003F674553
MNILNSSSFKLMERTLDAASLRQKITANNIANVDTPYYKRSDVQFEELLQGELNRNSLPGKRTHTKHIPIGTPAAPIQPAVIEDRSSVMNNNENNVDIDSEMSLMAKNQLRYNVLTQQVNSEMQKLRIVIEGRK